MKDSVVWPTVHIAPCKKSQFRVSGSSYSGAK